MTKPTTKEIYWYTIAYKDKRGDWVPLPHYTRTMKRDTIKAFNENCAFGQTLKDYPGHQVINIEIKVWGP